MLNKKFSKLKVKFMRYCEEGKSKALQYIENIQTKKDCREHSNYHRALIKTYEEIDTQNSIACNDKSTPHPSPLPTGEGKKSTRGTSVRFLGEGTTTKVAFTLAEVLITLVVIGVVAAVTVPMLNMSAAARANSQRQANIVAKITHATDMMRANGALGKFSTTDEFVDELQKYLKINKRCDANHIAECWPTAKVTTREGEEYEVANAKTRKDLGLDTDNNNGDVDNVGLILADGAHIILTYSPTSEGLTLAQESSWTSKALPTGNGEYEDFEYTSNTTGGLAFVMDVNGAKSPNKESVNTSYYDVRSFNEAHFTNSGNSCNQITIEGKKYCFIDSYEPINCTTITNDNKAYCTSKMDNGSNYTSAGGYSADYWAGAMKACAEHNAKLLPQTDLVAICNKNKNSNYSYFGTFSNYYWSSTIQASRASTVAWGCYLGNGCSQANGGYRGSNYSTFCIAN